MPTKTPRFVLVAVIFFALAVSASAPNEAPAITPCDSPGVPPPAEPRSRMVPLSDACGAQAASRRAKTPHQPQPTQAPDVQANRERYDRRVADAEEHKAQVQRRAASAKKDVKPLPVPP